jgi:hypothetical protein
LGAVAKSAGKAYKKGSRSLDAAREQSLQAWSAHVAKHMNLSFLPKRPPR